MEVEHHRKTWNTKTETRIFGLKFCLSHSWVGSTYSYSGQKSLRHIGNNDANEEDDGFQPGVSENQRQDKESHTEEDGHACDDVNKVLNLLSYGCLKKEITVCMIKNTIISTFYHLFQQYQYIFDIFFWNFKT